MKVWFLISVTKMLDRVRYQQYVDAATPVIESFGGRYIAASEVILRSRDWDAEKVVVIEFESEAQMEACFASEAYQSVAPLREGSIESSVLAFRP